MNYNLFYWAVTAMIVESNEISHVDFYNCSTCIYKTLYFIAIDTKRYSDNIVWRRRGQCVLPKSSDICFESQGKNPLIIMVILLCFIKATSTVIQTKSHCNFNSQHYLKNGWLNARIMVYISFSTLLHWKQCFLCRLFV